MRKSTPKNRVILPDPVFNEVMVTKFVNHLMYDGKKCRIYSELGVEKFEGEVDKDIMEIRPLAGINKYLLMSADGMEEVRLVK